MLEPHSRRLLLDALRPPEGYRLDFAVGTTYTLDLLALLTAPVALAFNDCEDNDGRPVMDPLVLLKAIRENAGKIVLFHHAGHINVPKKFNASLAVYLETSVYEAEPPLKGRFHPKMWALRFIDADDGVIYRVLCMSRNLTFDRSWDTMLVLEGPLIERQNAFSVNHPLVDFFEALPRLSTRKLHDPWAKRFRTLGHELRRVAFEVPEPFNEISFHPMGIDTASNPIPHGLDRLMVVSPFVDDTGLNALLERTQSACLVSRLECLTALKSATLDEFKDVWTLDDGSEAEPDDSGDAIPFAGLHAKLFIAERGWDTTIFTGSANATSAAFGRNVEFLVGLKGKRSAVGIDKILNGSGKPMLAELLVDYTLTEDETSDDTEKKFELERDRLADAIAAMRPIALCEAVGDSFQVRVKATKKKSLTLPDGCTLRFEPISVRGMSHVVDLSGQPFAVLTLSFEGLTSFFAFDLTSETLQLTRRFVLNIPLENPPPLRKERALQALLSDPAKVMKFLMMLLADESAQAAVSALMDTPSADATSTTSFTIGDATMFESLLQAMAQEPSRVDAVLAA